MPINVAYTLFSLFLSMSLISLIHLYLSQSIYLPFLFAVCVCVCVMKQGETPLIML